MAKSTRAGNQSLSKTKRKPASRIVKRTRTLEELGTILTNKGLQAAEEQYETYLDLPTADFASGDENTHRRRAMRRQGNFGYVWHGPPPRFDPPYVILEVTLKDPNVKYMTHGGEELLYVLPGADIRYEFFSPHDTIKPPWFQSLPQNELGKGVDLDGKALRVPPGCLIRINSSIPHRNSRIQTNEGSTDDLNCLGKAWIILRPLSGSPASLLVRPHTEEAPVLKFRRSRRKGTQTFGEQDIPFIREFTKKDLEEMDLGNYLLLASGISEKLALYRKRAELPVEKLAAECGLNKSYVSRLERHELPNVSIPTLLDLAEPVDADISNLISSLDWIAVWRRGAVPCDSQMVPTGLAPPAQSLEGRSLPRRHYLHPSVIVLRVGEPGKRFDATANIDDLTSLVVIEGEVVIRFRGDPHQSGVKLYGAGEVFHARHNVAFQAEAHKDSRVLVVRYSGVCSCVPEISTHAESPSIAGIKKTQDKE